MDRTAHLQTELSSHTRSLLGLEHEVKPGSPPFPASYTYIPGRPIYTQGRPGTPYNTGHVVKPAARLSYVLDIARFKTNPGGSVWSYVEVAIARPYSVYQATLLAGS